MQSQTIREVAGVAVHGASFALASIAGATVDRALGGNGLGFMYGVGLRGLGGYLTGLDKSLIQSYIGPRTTPDTVLLSGLGGWLLSTVLSLNVIESSSSIASISKSVFFAVALYGIKQQQIGSHAESLLPLRASACSDKKMA